MRYKLFICSLFFAVAIMGQGQQIDLTLQQSANLLIKGNKSLKIADKALGIAKTERQKMNSYWYPQINASGTFVHMSNKVEVKESMKQLTEPAGKLLETIFPDNQIIQGLLDEIGQQTLSFPLLNRNLTTADANVMWPIFTGGKRLYASKIGTQMVDWAKINKSETNASVQTQLVTAYYGVRLAQRVVDVRTETYNTLKKHYENAMKLEQNGMINKADRLFAQVSMDEAKRELESAKKELGVTQSALKVILNIDSTLVVNPTSPLFINDTIPDKIYFKSMIGTNSYMVNKLYIEQNMAHNKVNMNKSDYMPTIALIGRQNLYSNNIPKNLFPRTMIGVAVTWNLFDGLSREANVRQARYTEQMLQLGREKANDDLGVLVDKIYSEMKDAQDNVAALNATIEMSKELLRVRKKSFTEGMATSTDVIDAENLLSKVQIAYLLAYYQYDVALSSLLSTCGIPENFWQYSYSGKNEDFIFEK